MATKSVWLDRLSDNFSAGNLTIAQRDVLLALRSLLRCGNPTPSHAQIVRRSGTSRRTVQRALERGIELALLMSAHEFHGRNGWQSANWYRLTTPSRPVSVRQRRRTNKKLLILPGEKALPLAYRSHNDNWPGSRLDHLAALRRWELPLFGGWLGEIGLREADRSPDSP